MNAVCDVVFYAGHNLQVSQVNTLLDELLGPMKGRHLSDAMADNVQCDRFRRVVSSLLDSEMSVSQRPTTVLVPPVKFARQNPVCPEADVYEGFEAEILVADTGMWHGSGSADDCSWRYLVGLKGLTQASFKQTESVSEVAAVPHNMHSRIEMPAQTDVQTVSSASSTSNEFDIIQPFQTLDVADSLTNSSHASQSKRRPGKHSRPRSIDMGMVYLGHTQSRMATVPEQIPLTVGVERDVVNIQDSIWPVWAEEMTCPVMAVCLEDLMVQVPCSTQACCFWHNALSQVERGVTFLKRHRGVRCHPSWKPNDAWQCGQCGSLAEDGQDDCLGCGASGQAGHRIYPVIGSTVISL